MTNKLEITEYYELVALHKALMVARFARDPLNPAIPGSPFLADIANRIVEILVQMEIERGRPERANDWQMEISPTGERWSIAVKNASAEPSSWRKLSQEEKVSRAKIFLSPFNLTDGIVQDFIQHVDKSANERDSL